MRRFQKITAFALTLALSLSLFPVAVSAATEEPAITAEAQDEAPVTDARLTALGDSGAMWMKLRVNHCYRNGARHPLLSGDDGAYGAPMEIAGRVMLPLLPMLDFMGYSYGLSASADEITVATGTESVVITLGEPRAAVGGRAVTLKSPMAYLSADEDTRYLVVDRDDVSSLFSGWYITYDDMGLVILSETENIYNRFDDLSLMLSVMKEFIFDYPTGEEIYNDVNEFTGGFDHPYILTNEAELAHLRSIYQDGIAGKDVDRQVLSALSTCVRVADRNYKKYALTTDDPLNPYGEWVGPNEENKPTNPHTASGGYDPEGGRLEILEEYAGELFNLAIGYQLTLDDKYVHCGYYMMLALGEWEHWGPRHMLNTADGAFEITMFYDWTYDACVRLGLDVGRLEQILYEKAVEPGWLTTVTPGVNNYSSYTRMTNNWNAVCTSGLGITALAIMGNDSYSDVSSRLLSSNMESLVRIGLDPYAPDGTYVESAQYWGYATNVFFTLCMALDNAAGTDYGFMNLWGIEDTSYFACHTESSDLEIYTYNDASGGKQCTYFFFYCANKYDDPVLRSIRLQHIEKGKNCAIYDLLEYPFDGVDESADLPLDYMARAIDIYTARSSWKWGALFVGIMGGNNNVFGHGHIDGGSFVYHNHGSIWFLDLGSEDYNVKGYWSDSYRYRYYRLNAEGHNTLCLTSAPDAVPHGQVLNSYMPITDYESYDCGSFVTFDMTAAFGGYAESWYRGMLLTNDRETVVVQDQVVFNDPQTVYWFAHYSTNTVTSVKLSDDGRTAYLDGIMETSMRNIRVSIVGDPKLKFRLMNCYELVNVGSRGTYTSSQVDYMGVPEHSRDEYMKLAVVGRDVTEFNLAVVIESVMPDKEIEVGYEWQDMADWVPTEDLRDEYYETPEKVPTRGEADVNQLSKLKTMCELYLKHNEAYGERLAEYYRALTDTAYIFDEVERAKHNPKYKEYYTALAERAAEYDAFVSGLNGVAEQAGRLVRGVLPPYLLNTSGGVLG